MSSNHDFMKKKKKKTEKTDDDDGAEFAHHKTSMMMMVVSPSLCGLLPRTSWSRVIVFLCLSTHLASGPLSY
jgi:hypothetical protein